MNFTIHNGDNRDILKTLDDNSIDAIVTDPPYGIDFLGKSWDANTGALETYTECLRVLKPGGYILAFSAARTYHHLAVTLEQAGFEIRDQLMWLYSSGFPKAQDIGKSIQRRQGVEETQYKKGMNNYNNNDNKSNSHVGVYNTEYNDPVLTSPEAKQWEGWKTALKPAHEPICMARKPFKGSTIDNVLKHGVGALNIDATRIPSSELPHKTTMSKTTHANLNAEKNANTGFDTTDLEPWEPDEQGRFPSNVIGEVEGYQKFFYCPKVSRRERHCGFEAPPDPLANYSQGDVKNHPLWDPSIGTNLQRLKHKILEHNKDLGKKTLDHIPTMPTTNGNIVGNGQLKLIEREEIQSIGNNHPTVKPVELMKYLIKLVTPPNSTVLDPFTGSGSTGMAAVELGHTFIGCDLDPNYVRIAETRIEAWNRKDESEQHFESLFECL